MTRRQHVKSIVLGYEGWKKAWHYREGSLPWLLGGDWMYPYTAAWYMGKPVRHGPAIYTGVAAWG